MRKWENKEFKANSRPFTNWDLTRKKNDQYYSLSCRFLRFSFLIKSYIFIFHIWSDLFLTKTSFKYIACVQVNLIAYWSNYEKNKILFLNKVRKLSSLHIDKYKSTKSD
jgi:hypothetical protein